MTNKPRYVGTTVVANNPTMHVFVVDQLPNKASGALFITEQAYAMMRGSISPSEVTSATEEPPTNAEPVVLQRGYSNPPDACSWARDGDKVVFGCPRCGHAYTLQEPDFTLDVQGDVRPAFKCSWCSTHRYLHLDGWQPVKDLS